MDKSSTLKAIPKSKGKLIAINFDSENEQQPFL
jgi:hypothetical protein